ncbi:MAG: DegV family protein [Mycobacteriaceae bacterium]
MSVVVVTDSSARLPVALRSELGISQVPLHILVDGKDVREDIDDFPQDLAKGATVTTAGASQAELRQAYERALELSAGDGVLAVHLSRHLSSTWDAGRQAALPLGAKVRVVDSLSAGMGLGFSVLAAARAAATGVDLRGVYDVAVDISSRTRCLILVNSLDNLRRGGRIGTAAALLGTALAIKPVLHIVDGKLVLKEKTRTATKALAKIVDAVAQYSIGKSVDIAIHHQETDSAAEDLVDTLRSRVDEVGEVIVTDFGPALSAHVGPGALGVIVSARE